MRVKNCFLQIYEIKISFPRGGDTKKRRLTGLRLKINMSYSDYSFTLRFQLKTGRMKEIAAAAIQNHETGPKS
ncbi:unknown [Bacteroides sp. CAG:709]|nr:unknown [Bacteroides sp. CAG:709]